MRYRRALLVREDDTCFHLLEAPSAEAVIEASMRAGLEFERIVEVIETTGASEEGDGGEGSSHAAAPHAQPCTPPLSRKPWGDAG